MSSAKALTYLLLLKSIILFRHHTLLGIGRPREPSAVPSLGLEGLGGFSI